jgi:phosphatidylinositol 4-phosphatase
VQEEIPPISVHTAAMTFERFVLRSSTRWITVEPADPAVQHDCVLFFDRRPGVSMPLYSVRDRIECAALAEPDATRIIYGVVGVITLLVDSYLLVVDSRENAGAVRERDIYRATRITAIPVRGPKLLKADPSITKEERAEEASLRTMLNEACELPGFYFSHSIDITRSTQERNDMFAASRGISAVPDFSRADMRFVWNRYAGKALADAGITSWIVPLILGYVDVREGLVNGMSVQLAIISRRSADRPGLRFTARGADIYGNVSNFVETEQIVSHGDAYASYVQIRGSIPLLWQQEACIKYKPVIKLKAVDAGGKGGLSQTAFENHFKSLFAAYGPVTAVCLIDTHGSEMVLAEALANAVGHFQDSRLRYIHWDFHTKTKGMDYESIDNDLMSSIDRDLGVYSYFVVTDGNNSSASMRQKGVVRTNCIDSLDRTNVVQSVIAHRIMDDALKQMGVLNNSPETCTAALFTEFEAAFKATWANHADALSMVYAGTGALKTDYTRTGKRTKPGMILDGWRSSIRYVYQNFLDGRRQDGIDLLLGVVSFDKLAAGKRDFSSVKIKFDPLPAAQKYLPHAFSACILMSMVSLFAWPKWWQRIGVSSVCAGVAAVFMSMIVKRGHRFASRALLNGTN